jgi:hypothetical protein
VIQVFVALLNNIAIPCAVVAVVSHSCFYSVFTAAPTVTSPYAYQLCIEVVDGYCKYDSVNFGYSTYQPPFSYSFLCSSSFITYYSPVFAALCIIKTFVVPLGQLGVLSVYSRTAPGSMVHTVADVVLFPILKPVTPESTHNKDYYRVNRLLVEVTNIFGLLLTFGAVFPPLGIALFITIVVVTYFSRLTLGRFICYALESDQAEFVELIEQEAQKAGAVEVLWQSAWLLITFSCCFYTLFLFDTLGDAVGSQRALWVLFIVPMLPLLLYGAFTARHWVVPKVQALLGLPGESGSSTAHDGKDVELTDHADDAAATFNVVIAAATRSDNELNPPRPLPALASDHAL